jgi:uncharacterized protein (DUF58 family)
VLLRRCAQGLCFISLLLLSCALILDDMALLLAGGTLTFGILGQYFLFDNNAREIARSIAIQRTLSRNPIRKGSTVQVSAKITILVPDRMQASISDHPPSQTNLIDGVTTIEARSDPSPRTYSFRYRITPMVHGMQPFSGLSVTIRNLFFEETIRLTRAADQEPVLSVQSSGMFSPPLLDYNDGERESRKVSVWNGSDVHSLREYIIGDDLRHVDWKMTAKYDKMVIRKYTGLMTYPPLIIVDLPWNNAPYPENEFHRMVTEVNGIVNHTLQHYNQVSVLLISGPNIIHLIEEERNIARCMSVLREWMHPAERPVHFYHMSDRSDLRSQVRIIEHFLQETTDSQIRVSLELLRDRYLGILEYHRNPAFSGQAMRAISRILITEAYLFSLGTGDTSHIRHIVRPMQFQAIKVHIRIVTAARPGEPATQDQLPSGGKVTP